MANEKYMKFHVQPQAHSIERALKENLPFLKLLSFSEEMMDCLFFIIRELIKGAVTYGHFTSREAEITSFVRVSKNTVTIEVCAPVDMTQSHRLEDLDRAIQFIRGYQDPFEPYFIMSQGKDSAPGQSEEDNFPLAKIAYQGEAVLDFYVGEDDVLHLFAIKNLVD